MKNIKIYIIALSCVLCSSLYAQSNSYIEEEHKPYRTPIFSMGWGFIDGEGNPYALEASIGCNYFFKENVYAGARIGYLGASSSYYDRSTSIKSKNHLLTVPLELGYTLFSENRKWGVIPFVGAGINIGIKGKTEIKDYDDINHKIGGKIGLDGRIGLRLIISEFIISASYHAPINSKQEQFMGEDAYPEISIGWWIDKNN